MVRINIKLLVATPGINEICTLTILQSQAIKHRSLNKHLRIQCPSIRPPAIPESSMFKIIGKLAATTQLSDLPYTTVRADSSILAGQGMKSSKDQSHSKSV
jgi:hypothetical protein